MPAIPSHNPPLLPVATVVRNAPQWISVLLAAWFTACFIAVASLSLRYPFQLEWMEGQMIDAVQRVRDDLPLYAEPSIDYVSFLYTPLYYYAAAFVSLFTGVDFFPARLLSFGSALGCGALLYAWIRKEGGSRNTAFITAGLFFATYKASGRWFDTARVDSLFLLLTLAGLFVFYHCRGVRGGICAALLLAAAFFTKQAALLILLPVLAVDLCLDRRHALLTGGILAALVGGGVLAFNAVTHGWFMFYTFELEASHTVQKPFIVGFWTWDVRMVGLLLVASIMSIVLLFRQNRPKAYSYAALALGCIGCSYAARLNWGGYFNVLMPMHAALALLTGLLLARLESARQWQGAACAFLLAVVQMLLLAYNPAKLIPTEESRKKGEQFLAEIARIDGDVFIPDLQFVQTRVGKKSYALSMGAYDVLRTDLKDRNYIRQNLRRQIEKAIQSGRFAAVIPSRNYRLPEMQGLYRYKERLVFPPEYVTGATNFLKTDLYIRIPGIGGLRPIP